MRAGSAWAVMLLLHPCIEDAARVCIRASRVFRVESCVVLRHGVSMENLPRVLRALGVRVVLAPCRDKRVLYSLARIAEGLMGVYLD